jgi:hypothetical protein
VGVPTDNRRLARHRSIKDGFRRSDPEAGPDKGRQEAVKLHVREPRHAPLAARGPGKRQDADNRVRIVVKRFIEVPDAQEKNDAGVLAFQPGVLLEKVRLQSITPLYHRVCAALQQQG